MELGSLPPRAWTQRSSHESSLGGDGVACRIFFVRGLRLHGGAGVRHGGGAAALAVCGARRCAAGRRRREARAGAVVPGAAARALWGVFAASWCLLLLDLGANYGSI